MVDTSSDDPESDDGDADADSARDADASSAGRTATSPAIPGALADAHPALVRLPLVVAPTGATALNTVRLALLPIACWRLEDLRFDFDSSFIKPEATAEFAALIELWRQHGQAPLSIFGHADPVGKDEYNKQLSGRRANAVRAVMTRDVAQWAKLYDDPLGGDDWGLRSVQLMLAALGHDPGIPDGKLGGNTRRAVKDFQTAKGLPVDGDPGPQTRNALFPDYMDFLCSDEEQKPVVFTAQDFLARGVDAALRGDVQGCSEFNPILVFSQEEDRQLSADDQKPERDAANLPNRRVLVFLFPPGSTVDPANWPCPSTEDGIAKCQAQFYPDADARRSPATVRRLYENTQDTMACRFYDRMARRSPCEVSRQSLMLRLLNEDNEFIPRAVYRATLGNGEVRHGVANETGWLVEQNVETPEQVLVEWGYPTEFGISSDERAKRWTYPGPFGYTLQVRLNPAESGSDEEQAATRLRNLGYRPDADLTQNLIAFQRDYQVLPADGVLSDETKAALQKADDEATSRQEFIDEQSQSGS